MMMMIFVSLCWVLGMMTENSSVCVVFVCYEQQLFVIWVVSSRNQNCVRFCLYSYCFHHLRMATLRSYALLFCWIPQTEAQLFAYVSCVHRKVWPELDI